jgi:hypothetical protein
LVHLWCGGSLSLEVGGGSWGRGTGRGGGVSGGGGDRRTDFSQVVSLTNDSESGGYQTNA